MSTEKKSPQNKIRFDLNQLDSEGLIGAADAKRSLRYEFCIPQGATHLGQVREIDPSIELYPKSRGRILCAANQVLCIGETHKPNWREIILAIAALDYVESIVESSAE
jgi:hypothetical protein